MELTKEQRTKIKKVAKLVDFESKGAISLLEYLYELEDKYEKEIPELSELIEELKKERPDRQEIKEMVDEILSSFEMRIPKDGEDGDDYVLTEDDKKEIASLIEVPRPKPDKIIEKYNTETIIKEQPIEIIKEVAVVKDEDITSRPFAVRDALEIISNEEDKLKISSIGKLPEELEDIKKIAKEANTRVISNTRNFYQLLDAPEGGYVGQAGKVLKVKAGENGLEWGADSDAQDLQSVTGIGATTTVQSTFSGGLLTPQVKANTSAGILFESNNGTDVALFGAGGGAGATFYGGVNIAGNLAVDTDVLYVDTANNRVGIGTTTPAQLLHVRGAGARARINNTTGDPVLEMTSSTGTSFLFTRSSNWFIRTDSIAKHVYLNAGDTAASQGYVMIGNGSAVTPAPTSQLTIRGNVNTSTFGLLDAQSYAGTSRLSVTDIGAFSLFSGDTRSLQVIHGTDNTARETAYFRNTNTLGQAAFTFENNRGSYASYGGLIYGGQTQATAGFLGASNRQDKMFLYTDGASNLGFYIGNTQNQPLIFSTNNSERVRITGSGNFGINTNNPIVRFQVESTSTQMRLAYNSSNYMNATVGSLGVVEFDSVGGSTPAFSFLDTTSIADSSSNYYAQFANTESAYFLNNLTGNTVYICDSTNALTVTGNSVFNSYIQATGIILNETSPIDNSNTLDVNGSAGFYGGSYTAKFGDASNAIAGYLTDGTNSATFANGAVAGDFIGDVFSTSVFAAPGIGGDTYYSYGGVSWGSTDGAGGFTFTGGVKMQGLTSGVGPPATILTNFNLYVDTTTGIVYID